VEGESLDAQTSSGVEEADHAGASSVALATYQF
jgi:hypothetical protein